MMHPALARASPHLRFPTRQAVMARVGGENFPVATRVLSRRHRRHLLAVYGFARLADELGDELTGDRLMALDWLEQRARSCLRGRGADIHCCAPCRRRSASALSRAAPFVRLIEANRLDQRVTRYETWEQLRSYCELSANPVGELVLCVFGLATPERIELSRPGVHRPAVGRAPAGPRRGCAPRSRVSAGGGSCSFRLLA